MVTIDRFSGDNPAAWVLQAEQYFAFYNIFPKYQVSIASFYLDGEALDWYRLLFRNQQLVGWDNFVDKLLIRFPNRIREAPDLQEVGSEILRQLAELRDALSACATKLAVNSASEDQCELELPVDAGEVADSTHESDPASPIDMEFEKSPEQGGTDVVAINIYPSSKPTEVQVFEENPERDSSNKPSPIASLAYFEETFHNSIVNKVFAESLKRDTTWLLSQVSPHESLLISFPGWEYTLPHSEQFTVPNQNIGWIDTGQTSFLRPLPGAIHRQLKYFDGQHYLTILPECPAQDPPARYVLADSLYGGSTIWKTDLETCELLLDAGHGNSNREVIHYEGTRPIWTNMVMRVPLIDDSATFYPSKDRSPVCRDNLKENFNKFERHIDTILPAHGVLNQFPFDPGATLLLVTLEGYNNSFANAIDGLGIIGVFLMAIRVGSTNLPIEGLALSCFGFTLVQATEKAVFDTLQPKFFRALLFCQMSVNRSNNKYEVFRRSMFYVILGGSSLVICVWDPGITMRHKTDPWLSAPTYYVMEGYKNCSLFANEVTISVLFLKEIKVDIDLVWVLVEHMRSHPTIGCGKPLSIWFVVDYCYNAFKGPSIAREELIITLLQFPHVQCTLAFPFDPGTSLLNFALGISLVNGVPAPRRAPGASIPHMDVDLKIGPKSLPARVDFFGPFFQKHMQNLVYLCKCRDPLAVVDCWKLVNQFYDYPKTNFFNRIVDSLFNFAQRRSEFGLAISLAWTGWQFLKDPMEVFRVPIRANHDLTKFMPSWSFADGILALVFSVDLLLTTLGIWTLRSWQYRIGILQNRCAAAEQVMHVLKLVMLLLSTESIHDQCFNWFIAGALGTRKGHSILFLALIVFTKIVVQDKIFAETRGAPSRTGFTNNHTLDMCGVQILTIFKNIAGGMVVTGPGTICLSVVHGTNIKGAYQTIGVDMMQSIYETTRLFGVIDFLNLNATAKSMPRVIRYIIKCITYGGAFYSFEYIGDTRMFTPALQFSCVGWDFTVTFGVPKLKSIVACFLPALFSWDLFGNCASDPYFVDVVPDPHIQVPAMMYELRYSNLEDKVLIENGGIVMNLMMGQDKQDSWTFINGLKLGISLGSSPSTRQPNKTLIWDPG